MSASSKKKLRKEQGVAELTEKQRQEQAEGRKLKAYTYTFVAVILAIVIAAVSIGGVTLVKRSGIMEKKTIAATVDGQELNSVLMNYYFIDSINAKTQEWTNQYGNAAPMYAQLMGLDMSKPLNEQPYAEGDTTWADYFYDTALKNAQSDFALAKKAQEEGFTMSEEDTKAFEQNFEMLKMQTLLNYKSFDDFLSLNYCPGATEESFHQYLERSSLAAAYMKATYDGLTYEDADLREFEKDSYNHYSSYSYAVYPVGASSFLEGGTQDESGNTTYSDEEKAAAADKAKEIADSLTEATTVEELDAAIAALEMNADKENAESSKVTNALYSTMNEQLQEWISDSSRKAGDITAIVNESTSTDADGNEVKTVNGYNVVMFQERNDNLDPLANVRHILVSFEGGTPDQNGTMTYSEEEKAKAKAEAEEMLEQWKSGEATDESFAALATEKSDDKGSAANGGLIEDISRDSNLVENFLNWSVDEGRKTGDADIVESPYGYHVMYYVGDTDYTYRDYMIENALREKDLEQWHTDLTDAVTATKGDTSRIKLGRVIQPTMGR